MHFEHLYDFLERLQQNNHKEWMDAHRKEYYEVRDAHIAWLDRLNNRFAALDPLYYDTPGKKAINRINNNLLFHPNKPIYKDHFGAGLDQLTKQGDFYIEIGLQQNILAGGYWRPPSSTLRSIREAIDYDGERLKTILNKPSFKERFGPLVEDERLKNMPKGYDSEHPHQDLLKNKTFAVEVRPSRSAVMARDFEEYVVDVYKEMLPFRRYLREAVSV